MSDSKSGFGFPYEVESVVDHPPHYCSGKVEVIDVIEDWVRPAPDAVVGGCIGRSSSTSAGRG
jgi:hypothetical protein